MSLQQGYSLARCSVFQLLLLIASVSRLSTARPPFAAADRRRWHGVNPSGLSAACYTPRQCRPLMPTLWAFPRIQLGLLQFLFNGTCGQRSVSSAFISPPDKLGACVTLCECDSDDGIVTKNCWWGIMKHGLHHHDGSDSEASSLLGLNKHFTVLSKSTSSLPTQMTHSTDTNEMSYWNTDTKYKLLRDIKKFKWVLLWLHVHGINRIAMAWNILSWFSLLPTCNL